jgi:membrane protein insertase Oxa1/YidC/SpoIIIJ
MAPAGLGFYWTIGNLLSMLQTVVINKFFIKKEED